MRRVQEKLLEKPETDTVDQEPTSAPAASALKQKRLTFAWLDGEAQHVSFDLLFSFDYSVFWDDLLHHVV